MRALVAAVALSLVGTGVAEARFVDSFRAGATEPEADQAVDVRSPGRRGRLYVVPGRSAAFGSGPVRRFVVEVEGGLRVDRFAVARRVTRILADRRSWRVAVRRVSSGRAHFRIALASPRLTDAICAPLQTGGIFSCAEGNRAVLNSMRWRRGAASYGRDRSRYRIYLVNHEVGHVFGHGHLACPGAGRHAPVMMQQTKGVAPCRANPWPLRWER